MPFQPIKIKRLTAREILDSRGRPTVEATIETSTGIQVSASVPTGASKGGHEAQELRDGDRRRFLGLGVFKAVHNVEQKIAPKLKNKVIKAPQMLDKQLLTLDNTKKKSKLGANALLAVSWVGLKALAEANKLPLYRYLNKVYNLGVMEHLPTPMMNIINGGEHADTNLDIQELMVLPKRKKLLSEKIRMGTEIFYALGDVLRESGFDTDTGDEGGYAPDIHATSEAIRMVVMAVQRAGYVAGRDAYLAVDVAANTIYDQRMKQYRFRLDATFYNPSQLITLYEVWIDQFPFLSIEDGLAEDDWQGWQMMTKRLGHDVMIVGDDLFVSNYERLKRGIEKKAANAIVVKPNQVGTLTETIETVKLAQDNNMSIVVSNRSGETNDDALADLAVAVNADYIKCGSPNRGERVAKYNRLMAIEDEFIAGSG